jgi:rhamnose utilization protein RhaD (predicted bifunctional aldolase and dehydrogenase)
VDIFKIEDLAFHTAKIGEDADLVQGSGGNTSYKFGSVIWIKASGKRFQDALIEPIFAQLDTANLTVKEVLRSENFNSRCLNQLIPSIETNFHLLIEGAFVTHLHSLGSIALGISNIDSQTYLSDHGIWTVPYVRPGNQLAQFIHNARLFQKDSLLLRNHGIIFSGQSPKEIENKIERFESDTQIYIDGLPERDELPGWVEILVNGVLTPDEAVFLGKTPFTKSDVPLIDSISINCSGELLFPQNLSNDRIEMAEFYVRVAKMISKKTRVDYLPTSEVDSLLGWDKEIKRIELAK